MTVTGAQAADFQCQIIKFYDNFLHEVNKRIPSIGLFMFKKPSCKFLHKNLHHSSIIILKTKIFHPSQHNIDFDCRIFYHLNKTERF